MCSVIYSSVSILSFFIRVVQYYILNQNTVLSKCSYHRISISKHGLQCFNFDNELCYQKYCTTMMIIWSNDKSEEWNSHFANKKWELHFLILTWNNVTKIPNCKNNQLIPRRKHKFELALICLKLEVPSYDIDTISQDYCDRTVSCSMAYETIET